MITLSFSKAKLFLLCCALWWVVGGALLLINSNVGLFLTVNHFKTPFLDTLSLLLTKLGEVHYMMIIVAVIMLLNKKYRSLQFLFQGVLVIGIPFLVVSLMKNITNMPRPLKYFESSTTIVYTVKGYINSFHCSFPSGHTAAAFSFFLLLSLYLDKKYRLVSIPFFLLALSVAWTRMYLAQHFYIDIYFGSLVGTMIGLLSYVLALRLLLLINKKRRAT